MRKKRGTVDGKKDKDRRKAGISTIFFPLNSSVYNVKAITCCLCQRVWNNTLVREGKDEVKEEKEEQG